jgi:hypothetical protein
VVPASSRLHSWVTLRGLVEICSMRQDRFFLLILVIELSDGWEDFGSTRIPLQVHLFDSRPNYHRVGMRIQEKGIQYVYLEQTVMIRVVQRQRGDPWQRLAWDPGIAGLGISLTGRGEWIFARENHFDFPLSFSIEGSMSRFCDSLRSCTTSLWQ